MRLITVLLIAAMGTYCAQAFSAEPAAPPKFVVAVKPDRPDAMYHAGEKAVFTVTVKQAGEAIASGKVACAFSNDGIGDLGKSELTLGDPPPTVSGSLDQPGFLRLTATFKDGDQTYTGLAFVKKNLRKPD
jgi:cephalosporin-C deacetylase